MTMQWGRAAMFLLAGGVVLGLCAVSAVQAQVIHPDQMIGSPALQEAIPEGGVLSNEPAPGDLEKGFDRQMAMPETGPSGGMDTNMLKTPDATDAENARESDSQSAVSF
jgi:hypothetical protein